MGDQIITKHKNGNNKNQGLYADERYKDIIHKVRII